MISAWHLRGPTAARCAWRTGRMKCIWKALPSWSSRSMPETNRQITLAARPTGLPKESDFKLVESPVPAPRVGEILVRLLYVSVDPYMRGRMNDVKSYAPPVGIGEVMGAGGVGVVVKSNNPQFNEGDIVEGMSGWQDYAVSNGPGCPKD